MALYTPNAGELELLDKMLKDPLVTDENYILRLYQNNYTPDDSSVAGSFTEASFTNYAAVTMTRANWNASVTVSNKAESSYGSAPLAWTCGTTGNTVYGYYVSGATSSVVLWAEKFATSRVLANADVLQLTPKMTLNHE